MKKYVLILTIVVFIILTFAGCKNSTGTETTTEATTEVTIVETTEETTEKETEIITKAPTTTKAPETTKLALKPTEKPTETPTQKPTEPPTTKPSGGGLDTWDDGPGDPNEYVQDPDTPAEEIDKDAEENGWNTDWELN